MTTVSRFGTDKFLGTALRVFEGLENRRAWEAVMFPIHPKHHATRDAFDVYSRFTVCLSGTPDSLTDTENVLEFGGISYVGGRE